MHLLRTEPASYCNEFSTYKSVRVKRGSGREREGRLVGGRGEGGREEEGTGGRGEGRKGGRWEGGGEREDGGRMEELEKEKSKWKRGNCEGE